MAVRHIEATVETLPSMLNKKAILVTLDRVSRANVVERASVVETPFRTNYLQINAEFCGRPSIHHIARISFASVNFVSLSLAQELVSVKTSNRCSYKIIISNLS